MTTTTARPRTTPTAGIADRLATLLEPLFGGQLPIRLRAWDGSETGPAGTPVAIVRSSRVLRRMLWNPNELGLAQAYVTGELDVEGDLMEGLTLVWQAVRSRGLVASPRVLGPCSSPSVVRRCRPRRPF